MLKELLFLWPKKSCNGRGSQDIFEWCHCWIITVLTDAGVSPTGKQQRLSKSGTLITSQGPPPASKNRKHLPKYHFLPASSCLFTNEWINRTWHHQPGESGSCDGRVIPPSPSILSIRPTSRDFVQESNNHTRMCWTWQFIVVSSLGHSRPTWQSNGHDRQVNKSS